MSDVAKNVTVAEVVHANEMQENLRRRLRESHAQDASRMDTVRSSVLGAVVTENYDRAKEDIASYVEFKQSYPAFQERVDRHVRHCCELIEAIRTKRNFPGLASLSMSKQQELHERVLEHFEELKQTLKHIEKVERDHKLADVRSTAWVLKTFCWTVGLVAVTALIIDVRDGLGQTAMFVSQSLLDDASTWIVSRIPFLK